jgi:hypothetical protein
MGSDLLLDLRHQRERAGVAQRGRIGRIDQDARAVRHSGQPDVENLVSHQRGQVRRRCLRLYRRRRQHDAEPESDHPRDAPFRHALSFCLNAVRRCTTRR